MSSRYTLEFLGVWEQANNPDFNRMEFHALKNADGRLVLTPKRWTETTNAIGLFSKDARKPKNEPVNEPVNDTVKQSGNKQVISKNESHIEPVNEPINIMVKLLLAAIRTNPNQQPPD